MSHHLILKDLTVSFNRIPAIHHINLDLGCGSCVGLLGPNGAGKSTLLKAIAGLLPIETGSIAFDIAARQAHVVGSEPRIAALPDSEVSDDARAVANKVRAAAGAGPAVIMPVTRQQASRRP